MGLTERSAFCPGHGWGCECVPMHDHFMTGTEAFIQSEADAHQTTCVIVTDARVLDSFLA